jgi:putative pyruvate formate lyase activating enzyme
MYLSPGLKFRKLTPEQDILKDKTKSTLKLLESCTLCPHQCRVNRITGKKGFCSAPAEPVISADMPHHGEEPPISGTFGSGTIFFSHCNMKCVYCQNYQISQQHDGAPASIEKLADMMISLQKKGCHNINFVSPTIWVPQLISAVLQAEQKGLGIPLVYNTGGYDSVSSLKLLEKIIDIYMPDMRYSNDEMAEKYSGVKDYIRNNRAAVKEMYRQTGDLFLGSNGTVEKGILIRLLVLPGDAGGVKQTLDFIREELSPETCLSIMAQYHPEYMAGKYPEISRRVFRNEYLAVVNYAKKLGLVNGWTQDYRSLEQEDLFRPDFSKKNVFEYYKKKSER